MQAAAFNSRAEVKTIFHLDRRKRAKRFIVRHFSDEIILDVASVDGRFSSPLREAHAGGSGLATASAQKLCGALAHRLKRKWSRLLRLMRMIRPSVNFEFCQHLTGKTVFRKHAFDRVLDNELRATLAHFLDGPIAFTADISGVEHVGLLLLLLAG